jgi:hypothetical protein
MASWFQVYRNISKQFYCICRIKKVQAVAHADGQVKLVIDDVTDNIMLACR